MAGSQDKTEKPTRRKRQKARQEGQVAQSGEINNALVLLAAIGALVLFGHSIFGCVAGEVAGRLSRLYGPELSITGARALLCDSARTVARAAAPLMLSVCIVGLLCSIGQTGIIFNMNALSPKLGAINPISGFKRLFSGAAVVRMLVGLVKLAAIAAIVYLLVRSRMAWFVAADGKSIWGLLATAKQLCLSLFLRVVLVMVCVAALDYIYQRRRHEKKLMMSKQEVRDEHRRTEGDPKIKSRQFQMRMTIARRRMMQAVPEATVVVTNPTHVAVALKWDEEEMSAPQVVAKGAGHLAERIKKVARENGVPVLERKPLARALYQAVEVGMEIPYDLYYAVAEILAFVLRQKSPAVGR